VLKHKSNILFALVGLLVTSLLAVDVVHAVSPAGWIQIPNDPIVGPGPVKTGSFGTFTWPGKGDVTVDYSNVSFVTQTVEQIDGASTPEWDAILPPTPPRTIVVRHFLQDPKSASPETVTWNLAKPAVNFMIVVTDVDSDDVYKMTAVNDKGETVTDFSNWTVAGSGRKNASDIGPAPIWNQPTGTFLATTSVNTNRNFIAVKPPTNTRWTSFTFEYVSTIEDTTSNRHVDVNFYGQAAPDLSLGNLVWLDSNNNGIVDGNEKGIGSVAVELRDSTNTVIGTTTTDSNGNYIFTGLVPGDYTVHLPGSNFAPGGALVGLRSSTGAGDPNDQINNQDHGAEDANLIANGISSQPITLDWEQGSMTDGDSDSSTYLTVDFGLYDPNALAGGTLSPTGSSATLLTVLSSTALTISTGVLVYRKRVELGL